MGFALSRRTLAAPAGFAATALLFWLGNGLNPVWPLLWFAPLPVLLLALHRPAGTAGAVAGLAWMAGSLSMWHYLGALQLPISVLLAFCAIPSVIFALAVLLFRALARGGAYWSAVLAFPSAWVCYEFTRNFTTPHGTAGTLAYTQLNFLPFLQLAAITGPWGMTFVLLLFPAGLAVALYLRRRERRQAVRIAGATTGLLAAVLVFGAIRLAMPKPAQTVSVGLIASDQPPYSGVTSPGGPTESMFRDYLRTAQQLVARGAEVVVLPEKLGIVTDADVAAADALFLRFADDTRATVVAGLVRVSGKVRYNQARIYTPGAPVQAYDKEHMLPPFESDLKPGTAVTMLPRGSETWGVAICKDMDFTPLSRRYGAAGAGLMLVPAWDFRIDRWWHGHIAIMRGVEDGFSIARAARDGNLTVTDDRGRIVAETQSDAARFSSVLAKVPVRHDQTAYLVLGDWFAWFAAGVLIFTVGRLFRPTAAGERAVTHATA